MRKAPTKSQRLEDIVFGIGLPKKHAYGADHSPVVQEHARGEIFGNAAADVERGISSIGIAPLLTVLGAIERHHAMVDPPAPITSAGVELAQALTLQHPLADALPSPSDVDALLEGLGLYLHLFLHVTTKGGHSGDDPLSRRREQTLRIRHTFYPAHAVRVFETVGNHLTTFGHALLGMSLADVSKIVIATAVQIYRRASQTGSVEEIVRWWRRGTEKFAASWLDAFWVDVPALAREWPDIDPARINALLHMLSMVPGELAGRKWQHLALDNPVWRRPFVRIEDRFYCFSPGTVLSSHADILGEIASKISKRPGELLGKARGDALEEMAAATLRYLLPSARVLTSVKWTDPETGNGYETDLIVLVDGHVLIFESKGYVLSPVARRGSLDWFGTFDDIVVEAAVQTSRLARILGDDELDFLLCAAEGEVRLKDRDVRNIARFGVSLERVTMASYGLEDTLRRRIAERGADPMPIFTIGDLWQIGGLIDGEGRRLHYLLRRSEIDAEIEYIGDELDLLALYLKTGFVTPSSPVGHRAVIDVWGLSDFLRHYQRNAVTARRSRTPPRLGCATWARVIVRLEDRKPRYWTDLVYDLMSVERESQEKFLADIRSMRRAVRRKRCEAFPLVRMQCFGRRHPSIFFCLVSDKRDPRERLGDARSVFAELRAEHPNERMILFVLPTGKNADEATLEYYRGKSWGMHGEVELMDGVSPRSTSFIDASQLDY